MIDIWHFCASGMSFQMWIPLLSQAESTSYKRSSLLGCGHSNWSLICHSVFLQHFPASNDDLHLENLGTCSLSPSESKLPYENQLHEWYWELNSGRRYTVLINTTHSDTAFFFGFLFIFGLHILPSPDLFFSSKCPFPISSSLAAEGLPVSYFPYIMQL